MGTTVTGFLHAYLAGGKDLERYIAPTFSVSAVAATPYKTAEILSIRTDQDSSTSNEKALMAWWPRLSPRCDSKQGR